MFLRFLDVQGTLTWEKLGILELARHLGLDEFIVGMHSQLLQDHDIVRRVAESLGYRGNPLFPILRYDHQSPVGRRRISLPV